MQTDPGSRLLSDLVFIRTYAETKPDGTKERPEEAIDRVCAMHVGKFPHLRTGIEDAFRFVHSRHVVPSMRSMQFAGDAIRRSNIRIFNCSALPIENFKDIADAMFISMNGSGVGFSVQRRHVDQLPIIRHNADVSPIDIEDTKEAWADSLLALLENPWQTFTYGKIRAKGSLLSTGGTASGPESLAQLHEVVRAILLGAVGRRLRPIEVHDIMCHIGDLVFCGGVRRTALISLFDADDQEMLTAKHGNWWEIQPQRARANNSAVILRTADDVEERLRSALAMCFASNAGEPGVFLTNDCDWGANPCLELILRPRQFCNLSEINAAACRDKSEFLRAAAAAAIIGSLQASYTDFNYIDERWRKNTEEEALLGVSITGQAQAAHLMTPEILREAAELMKDVNSEWAKKLGTNPAARIGCTKPSGSTSAWLGTTSGVHGAHSDFYLRRVRVDKVTNAPIVNYLVGMFGLAEPETKSVVERDAYSEDVVVVSLPVSLKGAIKRDEETAVQLMERSKTIFDHWIVGSHRSGAGHNNVSLTVSYKPEEVPEITEWVVVNRESFTGVSFLPFDGGTYRQMPFETITESEYYRWLNRFPASMDLFGLDYSGTIDARKAEPACAGGACEVH